MPLPPRPDPSRRRTSGALAAAVAFAALPLAARAATSSAPPEDRISRSAWFRREHREVSAATWALPAVKSAANCGACHTQADQGDFSERHIRLPR